MTDRFAFLVFAIQNTKYVPVEPRLTQFTERLLVFTEFFLEYTSKNRPAFLTANGVNLDLIPLKVYAVKYPGGHTDSFHVQ